jgi:hypothetical protein
MKFRVPRMIDTVRVHETDFVSLYSLSVDSWIKCYLLLFLKQC